MEGPARGSAREASAKAGLLRLRRDINLDGGRIEPESLPARYTNAQVITATVQHTVSFLP